VNVSDFDYDLPDDLIAQGPPPERGASRLLVLPRDGGPLVHTRFDALTDYLRGGDLLALNNTRVFPARLIGNRVPSGGAVECLLVRRAEDGRWEALVHPGQKLKPGSRVLFARNGVELHGEILERHFYGRRTIRLWTAGEGGVDAAVDAIGHVPLPPYIKRDDRPDDRERYQTVYARERGSIAAPTAGLHFTPDLLLELERRGIERAEITLHVGYGTFKPVRTGTVEAHTVDAERFSIDAPAAAAISRAMRERRRIVAVGTTTVRALESLDLGPDGEIRPIAGETTLFIYPGRAFRIVQGLITNFHLPRSSLLMLVAAFAGRERVMATYREAVAERYRFYSYGDAMLII
jgi:S-adenosylmethionine:tRNA ribosyltransferase-isomerase